MKRQFQLLRFFTPLLKPYRTKLVFAFIALSIAAGAILFTGLFIRDLIDKGFAAGNDSTLNQALLTFICLSFVLAIAAYLRTYTTASIAEKVVIDLKKRLFNHTILMNSEFFEIHSSGEILSRLNGDMVLVRNIIAASGAVGLRSLIQFIGALFFLALTSLKLTFYVFLLLPLLLLPLIILGRQLRQHSRKAQDALERVQIHAEETFQGIQTIQIFRLEEQTKQKFSHILHEVLKTGHRRIQARSFFIAFIIALAFSTVSILLWVGGRAVIKGEMTMGELSSFVFYAVVAAGSFNSLSEVISDIQASGGGIERIYDLLMTASALKLPKKPYTIDREAHPCLEIKDVTFYYPSKPDNPALKNFTLTVHEGEHVALVGPSGSGKSTLFRLLLRLYEPQHGQIYLHNRRLDTLDIDDVRKYSAIVPQECTIFNTTLWENIQMVDPDASDSDVLEACRVSYIHEFVESLPDQYHTVLGERGVRVSAGQRQRIAIARAILRKPKLLLLDEATSALDAHSEDYVHRAIDSVMRQCTTIIAAHRLSTVINAHRIIVIEDGEIVAQGKHADLIKLNGLYARLAEKQLIA